MTKRTVKQSELLNKIADIIVQDILDLTDEEILAEAKERFGDPKNEIDRLRGVIGNAVLYASKKKLAETKASLSTHRQKSQSSNVVALSTTKKRSIVEQFTSKDSELQKKLTIAARKGEGIQTDNDINGMFEDLVELGLVDKEGKPE